METRLEGKPEPSNYHRHRRYRRHERLTLKRVWRGFGHQVRAETTSGLCVQVDTESLTLDLADTIADTLVKGRQVEVVRDSPRPERYWTTLDAGSLEPALSGGGHASLQGIIAGWPGDTDHPQAQCELWVKQDQKVCVVQIPLAGRPAERMNAGDLVTLTRSSGGRWEVSVRGRLVNTVGLWSVQDRTPADKRLIYLGVGEVDGQPVALAQVMHQPLLIRDPRGAAGARPLDIIGGRPDRLPKSVRVTECARFPDEDQRMRVRVEANVGRSRLYGLADPFVGERRMVDSSMIASVRRDGLLAVRREMRLVEPRGVFRPSSVVDPKRKAYEDWLKAGDPHWDECTYDVSTGRVRLRGLYLEEEETFIDDVPVLDEEPLWVPNSGYTTESVRVLLTQRDGRWIASCRPARPMTLEDFVKATRPINSETTNIYGVLRVPVYYAGSETLESGHRGFRFEWGYGKSTLVSQDSLSVNGRSADLFAMYFGDRLRRARFRRAKARSGGDGYTMEITPSTDVDWKINPEHVIYRQANVGEGYRLLFPVRPVVGPDGRMGVREVRRRATNPDTIDKERSHHKWTSLRRPATLAGVGEEIIRSVMEHPEQDQLLATFDLERYRRTEGREVRFIWVSELDKGDFVPMEAGRIKKLPNDFVLEFRLPKDVYPGRAARKVVVPVSRRFFSHRESLLRRLYEVPASPARGGRRGRNEEPDARGRALEGWTMLVEIQRPGRSAAAGIVGSTKNSPARPAELLPAYLRSRNGHCLAVVAARPGKGKVRLEMRPGAVYEHEFKGDAPNWLRTGAIIRLALAADGKVSHHPAIASDRRYLAGGRAVEILPKNHLLDRSPTVKDAAQESAFTVVGLPGLGVTADSFGERLMRAEGPKLAMVEGSLQVTALGNGVAVGWVGVDERRRPVVERPQGPHDSNPDDSPRLSWSQLSFRDCGAAKLAALCGKSTLHYHDERTGSWKVDERTSVVTVERKSLRGKDSVPPPVFFDVVDGRWSLRYRQGRMVEFGFPAGILVEERIGTSAAGTWYAVAGIARDERVAIGLWIELSPGHVVDLSGHIMLTEANTPLDNMHWEYFAPGDQIRLALRKSSPMEPDVLVLKDWRPGPRGVMSRGCGLILEVTKVCEDEGSLALGRGEWSMTYPVDADEAQMYKPGQLVRLDEANRLCLVESPPLSRGDVIWVGWAQDGIHLPGDRTERTRLAAAENWPAGSGWIRDALAEPPAAERLVEMCGGRIPLEIVSGSATDLELAWPKAASANLYAGRTMYGRVIGRLDEQHLVVRCGSSLLRIEAQILVPRLPIELVDSAVERLRELGTHLLWHTKSEPGASVQLRAGLPMSRQPGPEVTVEFVGLLGPAPATPEFGLLCRDPVTWKLHWMPAGDVSWVADITADELQAHVVPKKSMLVAVRDDGTVSRIHASTVSRRLEALRTGDELRVQIVSRKHRSHVAASRFLVSAYLTDVLLEIEGKETEFRGWRDDEPIFTDVAECRRHPRAGVVVVPKRQLKTILDLPHWLPNALKTGSIPEDQADRLSRYREMYDAGVSGESRLDSLSSNPDWAMMNCAGLAVRDWSGETLNTVLNSWLRRRGAAAFGTSVPKELDLASSLAAVLVLNALWRQGNSAAGAGSVYLAWRVGVAAMRSLHVEPLVRNWLLERDNRSGGLWRRLKTLDLSVRLEADERRRVLAFCTSVTSRIPGGDDNLRAIAQALLMAMGTPDPACDPLRWAPMLGRLVVLGRSLVPGAKGMTAFTHLPECHLETVNNVLEGTLRANEPLTLLAPLPRQADPGGTLLDALIRSTRHQDDMPA